jgi:hypothetical protein
MIRGNNTTISFSFNGPLFTVNNPDGVTIQDLNIIGNGSEINNLSGATTDAQIEALTGIGTQSVVTSSGNNSIDGLTLQNINVERVRGTAFRIGSFFQQYSGGVNIENCHVSDSDAGFHFFNRSEYSTVIAISATDCKYGVIMEAGNIIISNSKINQNRVGIFMKNAPNEAHSTVSSTSINHNELYGIFMKDVELGHVFTGCQMWDSPCRIVNSSGFVFSNGMVASRLEMENVPSAVLVGNVSPDPSLGSYGAFNVTQIGTTNVFAHFNYRFDGTAITIPQ